MNEKRCMGLYRNLRKQDVDEFCSLDQPYANGFDCVRNFFRFLHEYSTSICESSGLLKISTITL